MVAVLHDGADELGDLILRLNIRLVADGVGEVSFGAVAENGAAVCFRCVALAFELVEVAADGLLRDAVVGGKLTDKHALLGTQLSQNFIFSFDRKHRSHRLLEKIGIPHKTTFIRGIIACQPPESKRGARQARKNAASRRTRHLGISPQRNTFPSASSTSSR